MKCWNCGLGTMKPSKDLGEGWFKCTDCGATWTEIPKPGVLPMSVERDDSTGGTKYKPRQVSRKKKVKK